jgi:lauroyl/myristoyl acyltransferase
VTCAEHDTTIPPHRTGSVPAGRPAPPVVVGSIRRLRDGGHEVTIESCPLPGGERAATALITRRFEERVRRRPSQWVWFHERWRTGPA